MPRRLIALLLTIAFTASLAHAQTPQGNFYISPDSGSYQVGQPLTLSVYADTDSTLINAAEAEIAYNPLELEIESISKNGSVLSTWSTEPSFDGAAGLVRFSGWVDQPYKGSKALLITIIAIPKKAGSTRLVFNSGSMLSAQGQGTNILTAMRPAAFTLTPLAVVPSVAPTTTLQTLPAASTSDTNANPSSQAAAVPLGVPPSSQSASVLESGVELAPYMLGFLAILTVLAFCIAYILHRLGRS